MCVPDCHLTWNAAEMSLQDTFSRFECGNASINKYLSENALSDDETVTYIYSGYR